MVKAGTLPTAEQTRRPHRSEEACLDKKALALSFSRQASDRGDGQACGATPIVRSTGAWHCGNDFCTWAASEHGDFDQKNHC